MKYCWIFFIFLFPVVNSQIVDTVQVQMEQKFREQFDSAKNASTDSMKILLMARFENEFVNYLKKPATYPYPFDSIKKMGKVYSPDNKFRMLNWNIDFNRESFRNYCIIQFNPQKGQECQVIVLHDKGSLDEAGNTTLTANNWYGALYYKIIPVNFQGHDYYTLLGFDSFSPFISKKIIDVLYFKNGIPHLGAPIFNSKGKFSSRVVFSFSARITMLLNYDENINTIVFDHLSPTESRYTGQFEYYGPDFSFDGFAMSSKEWLFIEDIKPNRTVPMDKNTDPKRSNDLKVTKQKSVPQIPKQKP